MSPDDPFRMALAILAAVFLPIGLYFRIRSHTGENLDRRQERMVILIGLRLTGLVLLSAAVGWLLHPAWFAWTAVPLSNAVRNGGLVMAVLGGCLIVWTFRHLGKNLTDTVVTRAVHSLVTTGPYVWVRHPFYCACLLGLVGTSLAMANAFFPIVGGIGVFFLVLRTRIEEQKLVDRFGADYQEYMRRTGRFFPRIGPARQFPAPVTKPRRTPETPARDKS